MAAGYTRVSSGLITTSATIQASHFNNEYDAIQAAFHATTGHTHDGTAGGGAPVPLGGSAVSGTLPLTRGGTGVTSLASLKTSLGIDALNYFAITGAIGTTPTAASGTNGLAIGDSAVVVTGTRPLAIGKSYASGDDSVAIGVADNTITYGAQGTRSVVIGYRGKITGGTTASIFGGSTNTITTGDTGCVIVGGSGNTITSASITNTIIGAGGAIISPGTFGVRNLIIGGTGAAIRKTSGSISDNIIINSSYSDIVDADDVLILDGELHYVNKSNVVVSGHNSYPSISYASVQGAYNEDSDVGGGQKYTAIAYAATSGATPVVFNLDNNSSSSNAIAMPNNSVWAFDITVVIQRTNGSARSRLKRSGLIYRVANAASTSLESTVQTVGTDINTAGYTLAITAETTVGGLKIELTGVSGHNTNAVAYIDIVETQTPVDTASLP